MSEHRESTYGESRIEGLVSTSPTRTVEPSGDGSGPGPTRNPFARIALFIRQVVSELRKVRTPSRAELASYSVAVLVFVAVMIGFVFALDFVFAWLANWAFAGV